MKKIIKITIFTLALVANVPLNCVTASAAEDYEIYYYDVKKAGDYVLNYCDAEHDDYGLPKRRMKKSNNVFITLDSDCTNFVSQALYYGGYPMKGTPPLKKSFPATTPNAPNVKLTTLDWYYYKFINSNTGAETYEWTSTWSLVDGIRNLSFFPNGIDDYFSKSYLDDTETYPGYKVDPICNCSKNLSYKDVVELSTITDEEAKKSGKHKIHRGDILQLKDDKNPAAGYEHSCFIWCTEPEIRVSSHTSNYLAKPLKDIEYDFNGEPRGRTYRIIHTTDHAMNKNPW